MQNTVESYLRSNQQAGNKANSLIKQVIDGAGICMFALPMNVSRFPIFEYLNAATGWQKTPTTPFSTNGNNSKSRAASIISAFWLVRKVASVKVGSLPIRTPSSKVSANSTKH